MINCNINSEDGCFLLEAKGSDLELMNDLGNVINSTLSAMIEKNIKEVQLMKPQRVCKRCKNSNFVDNAKFCHICGSPDIETIKISSTDIVSVDILMLEKLVKKISHSLKQEYGKEQK